MDDVKAASERLRERKMLYVLSFIAFCQFIEICRGLRRVGSWKMGARKVGTSPNEERPPPYLLLDSLDGKNSWSHAILAFSRPRPLEIFLNIFFPFFPQLVVQVSPYFPSLPSTFFVRE